MNSSRDQLQRLLRGTAAARRTAVTQPAEVPKAAWLIARTQRQDQISLDVFMILRRGLVAACILLVATGIIAVREIREQQAGVMGLAIDARLEIGGAFVP